MEKQDDVYFLQFTDILSNKDICVEYEIKRRVCRSLIVTDIGKALSILDIINVCSLVEGNKFVQGKLKGQGRDEVWIWVLIVCDASKPNMINIHSKRASEFCC